MRRTAVVLLLLLAACALPEDGQSSETTLQVGTSSPGVAESTTSVTSSDGSTTSSTTETTSSTSSTTLPPLQGLQYEEVARLPFPVQMVPWAGEFAMVATKDGRIWLYDGSDVSETPVLDIRDRVRNRGEQGLLSIAVHPNDTNRVFAHYSGGNGDTIVSEFAWDNGSLKDERVLFRLGQPASNHNGGMIQFDADGRLFLGLGDGGGSNDRFDNGQNLDTLLGGLVVFDVDSDAEPDLFGFGLRNPWRFWIDGIDIYIADVGQNKYEEVSVSPLTAGLNFGWPITEGNHCFRPADGCDMDGLTLPVVEVPHGDAGTCSITGGEVYRGESIPELVGVYFYSDFCGGYLRGLRYESGRLVEEFDWTDQVGLLSGVVGFGSDSLGEIYVATPDQLLKVIGVRG
jgi:glucose/arabinose dehydrogenase